MPGAGTERPTPHGTDVTGDTVGADTHVEAGRIAAAAGALLLELRADIAPRTWTERRGLSATADRYAHELIVAELAASYPDDVVFSEEGDDDPARLRARRVWIVDPLDGSWQYAEPGRRDWAVHVALWQRSENQSAEPPGPPAGRVVVGAVALPALDEVHTTSTTALAPAGAGVPPRFVVSRNRPAPSVLGVAEALGAELVALGSAGAKAMAVVRGEVDGYLHDGGQYEWDSAAPIAVARAAGLHVSRLDGRPLAYNQPDPWLPDLMVCRRDLAADLLAVTRATA